jgi:glucosylceramidase
VSPRAGDDSLCASGVLSVFDGADRAVPLGSAAIVQRTTALVSGMPVWQRKAPEVTAVPYTNKLALPLAAAWIAYLVSACGSSGSQNDTGSSGSGGNGGSTAGGGGAPGSGGIATGGQGFGGASMGSGGAQTGTGGGAASGTGGGVSGVGGASAGTGGQTMEGTGGAGLAAAGGGSSSGGRSGFGGASASGGRSAGGASASGGRSAGGASASGGRSAGGASVSGGSSAGGASASGGSSAETGGASTGGGGQATERPQLVTSGPGAYWKEGTLTPTSGGQATVTVNASRVLQKWIGFGGTFNEAGWDALSVLSASERDRAIRLLFSATEGANFAWGRIPIGASDYAMDRYTLDETAGDYQMNSFSIARDKLRLIPYVQAALAVKADIRFWASPWTPPSWMKDPPQINGTDAPPSGGSGTYAAKMKSDAQTQTAFALYLARFVEEYGKEGIHIDSVHPQNEPGYATRYPSCIWDAGLLGSFVGNYLAPAFQTRGLDTDIWFGTLSNDSTYSGHIGGLTGATAQAVVGVGLQWNTMSHIGDLASRGYLVMQTEHKCGNYPFSVAGTPAFNPDKPPNDHAYAVESWGYIRDWIKANANAYSAWNMVLDTAGKNLDEQRPWPQNALLVVDRASAKLIETPVYYVFRHLSYFVDPGADRVETTGGDAVAFKNPDGSLVVVVYNSGGQAAQMTIALGQTSVQVQVPGQGWATVNWKG